MMSKQVKKIVTGFGIVMIVLGMALAFLNGDGAV